MIQNARWFRPLIAVIVFLLVALFLRVASYDLSSPTRSIAEYAKSHGVRRDFDSEIKNSTLGFEKIFVLNLPERPDKLDAFTLTSEFTGFQYEVIEGVKGGEISEKALPPGWDPVKNSNVNVLGAYRAHLNFARRIVADRLSSAMVFEDDSDWDIDLKNQLTRFAIGSRLLTSTKTTEKNSSPEASSLPEPEIDTVSHSPYGDGWDMLWLGHCAATVKEGDNRRLVIENDPGVAPPQHRTSFGGFPDMTGYSNSTRIVFESQAGICMYGYALSLQGAKKAIYHMSLSPFNIPVDLGYHDLCKLPHLNFTCISVYPTLVDSHKAAGNISRDSDIGHHTGGIRQKGFTWNIVRSVRLNLGSILGMRQTENTIVGQWDDDPEFEPITGEMKLRWDS